MKNKRIEGYWYSNDEYNKDYPVPKPNVLTDAEAQKIYELIKEKQKNLRKLAYKGWSTSRITGEKLGSTEYFDQVNNWTWPCDFAKHYVLDHKVKPTDDFLKYIGYENQSESI